MSLTYALRLERNGIDPRLLSTANYAEQAAFAETLLGLIRREGAFAGSLPAILGFPLQDWRIWSDPGFAAAGLDYTLVRLAFETPVKALAFGQAVRLAFGLAADFGVDPRIGLMDAWLMPAGGGATLGDTQAALSLIRAEALAAAGARGRGVNVFIVDCGVEQAWVRRQKRRLGVADADAAKVWGWTRDTIGPGNRLLDRHHPGTRGSPHGEMIARCVLRLAPEAQIWDVPLIGDPSRPPFLGDGTTALNAIRDGFSKGDLVSFDSDEGDEVTLSQRAAGKQALAGRCVVVNAWGVFDTGLVRDDLTDYGDNPKHVLTREAPGLDAAGIDIVFCAGNCGEPIPDARCGEFDRGPGRSSSGLNAHPNVLSVGAVRPDGLPVALSSQGPGRLFGLWPASDAAGRERAREKPDLCAPSHFRDDDDGSLLNTGSSAAAGVAAGVVAALRSLPGAGAIPPAELRAILRDTAQRPGQAWDPQLGWGVIDCAAAVSAVRRRGGLAQV